MLASVSFIRLGISWKCAIHLNPLYTGGLVHCYTCMLEESICRLGMSGLLYRFILYLMEKPVTSHVGLDQPPHLVASDLGLLCLPMNFFTGFKLKMGKDQYLLLKISCS